MRAEVVKLLKWLLVLVYWTSTSRGLERQVGEEWESLMEANEQLCAALVNTEEIGGQPEDYFCCCEQELIPRARMCDGNPDCSNALDESVNFCGCLPNEFRCEDTCINAVHRCDRIWHCPDGSDEQDCELYQCPSTHSKCDNHYCIPEDAICNFVDDCGDNSDEKSCQHRRCLYGEFRCMNGQCTRPGLVCDGHKNCIDGSDEKDCSTDDFAICEDGSRVHKQFWCDEWPECKGNHTDETICGDCPEGGFKCANNRCLRPAMVCDAFCDCAGTCEDEKNCDQFYTSVGGHLRCITGQSLQCYYMYQPTENFRCVATPFICDGHNDCYNGGLYSDEYGCPVPPSTAISTEVLSKRNNTDEYFCCTGESDPRCLPAYLQCDFHIDCLHGEDELDCGFLPCQDGEFKCTNTQCINGTLTCDGKYDCVDKSDETNCEDTFCPKGMKKCHNGICIPEKYWCDYRKDCADGSDELSCDRNVTCQDDEFRCLNGQCIPLSNVCFISGDDPRSGCADRSHLSQCNDVECPLGWYKCLYGSCLDARMVCDGNIDCKGTWSDEDFCPFECAADMPQCPCLNININCTGLGIRRIPQRVELGISRFYFASNYLNETLTATSLDHLTRSVVLDLRNNSLTEIPVGLFRLLWKLRVLHLEFNHLKVIRNGTFVGLSNLQALHLDSNDIVRLESFAFYGLSALPNLNLARQAIEYIAGDAFTGLRKLSNLDLSYNKLTHLEEHTFTGLNLQKLDLCGNYIVTLPSHIFRGLTSLRMLSTDEFRFCCLARHVPHCSPPKDEFSSCEDLMSNLVLRVCVWILGVVAVAGNILVIVWRLTHRMTNRAHSCLTINLAVGDLCMGIYLIVIAMADVHYRGSYAVHDQAWRTSSLCHLAGFMSTFSSELSVFTLTVITLDRFLVIIFPFRDTRLNIKRTRLTMMAGWLLVTFLAALPLFEIDYFTNFYGRSGVCLPLHITPEKHSGWEYSVFVFIVLNFLSMCIIAVCYLWMYLVAKNTQRAVTSHHGRREDQSMAHRMTLIVATDAACWLPIIALGVASLGGATIPPQVFAWVAVFVLPLNAAINPILYTISTAPFLNPISNRIRRFPRSVRHTLTSVLRRSSREDRVSVMRRGTPIVGNESSRSSSDRVEQVIAARIVAPPTVRASRQNRRSMTICATKGRRLTRTKSSYISARLHRPRPPNLPVPNEGRCCDDEIVTLTDLVAIPSAGGANSGPGKAKIVPEVLENLAARALQRKHNKRPQPQLYD